MEDQILDGLNDLILLRNEHGEEANCVGDAFKVGSDILAHAVDLHTAYCQVCEKKIQLCKRSALNL